jgi:hypothetical protein
MVVEKLLNGDKLQEEVLDQVWEKSPNLRIFESFVKDSR